MGGPCDGVLIMDDLGAGQARGTMQFIGMKPTGEHYFQKKGFYGGMRPRELETVYPLTHYVNLGYTPEQAALVVEAIKKRNHEANLNEYLTEAKNYQESKENFFNRNTVMGKRRR